MQKQYSADSNLITRAYLDSLLIETRTLDSALPNLSTEIFGVTFQTPVMTAALSHLHNICEDAMCEIARGAKAAGALHWYGMGEDEELEQIVATGAQTIKIIKPHADSEKVFAKIEHASKTGVFAMGMDIDHAYSANGQYDNVMGLPMRPITTAQLRSYADASPVPFIVKGVLSVADAVKCAEAGVSGIVLSHHHGIFPYAVPPLMMLPEIKKAVGDTLTIFVDCNVETGYDVFKALALGADAVSIGRRFMEPLKQGARGVYDAFQEVNGQLASLMARTGSKTIYDIDSSVLHQRNF